MQPKLLDFSHRSHFTSSSQITATVNLEYIFPVHILILFRCVRFHKQHNSVVNVFKLYLVDVISHVLSLQLVVLIRNYILKVYHLNHDIVFYFVHIPQFIHLPGDVHLRCFHIFSITDCPCTYFCCVLLSK